MGKETKSLTQAIEKIAERIIQEKENAKPESKEGFQDSKSVSEPQSLQKIS